MSNALIILTFTLMVTFAMLFGAVAMLYRFYRSQKKYISEVEVKSVPSLYFHHTLTPKLSDRLKVSPLDSRDEASFYWLKPEDETEMDLETLFGTLQFQPKRTSTHGNIYQLCL